MLLTRHAPHTVTIDIVVGPASPEESNEAKVAREDTTAGAATVNQSF